jgi:uncharacterized membrane protein YphA (DoxX/SURF4 family)
MHTFIFILQIVVALGLLNVWLLRFNRQTAYRGGQARNLREEFAAYGLPAWFTYLVGFLKVTAALCLLIGIRFPALVFPAAAVVSVLMIGALAMHAKVRDPFIKSLPALTVLIMTLLICIGTYR